MARPVKTSKRDLARDVEHLGRLRTAMRLSREYPTDVRKRVCKQVDELVDTLVTMLPPEDRP